MIKSRTLVLTCVVWAGLIHAQEHKSPRPIKVAVSITDSTTQFGSAFAAAFRQLGDIDVVSVSESPDFVLSGIVMCQPACANLTSYAVSLRLYSPMHRSVVSYLAISALLKGNPPEPTLLRKLAPAQDSLENVLWPTLRNYELTLQTWVGTSGRQRYEQAIREIVREIDTACFEKERPLRRAVDGLDTNALKTWANAKNGAKWSC